MADRGIGLSPHPAMKPRVMPKPRHLEKSSTLSTDTSLSNSLSSSPPQPRPKPRNTGRNWHTLGPVTKTQAKPENSMEKSEEVNKPSMDVIDHRSKPPLKQKPVNLIASPRSSPSQVRKQAPQLPPRRPLPDLPVNKETDHLSKYSDSVHCADESKCKPEKPPKPDDTLSSNDEICGKPEEMQPESTTSLAQKDGIDDKLITISENQFSKVKESKADLSIKPQPNKPLPPRPPPPHLKCSSSQIKRGDLDSSVSNTTLQQSSPPLKPRRKLPKESSHSSNVKCTDEAKDLSQKDASKEHSENTADKVISSSNEHCAQPEEKKERKNSLKEMVTQALGRCLPTESKQGNNNKHEVHPPPPQKPPPQLPLSTEDTIGSPRLFPKQSKANKERTNTKSHCSEVRTGQMKQQHTHTPTWFTEEFEESYPLPYEIVELNDADHVDKHTVAASQSLTLPAAVSQMKDSNTLLLPDQKLKRRMAKSHKQFVNEKCDEENSRNVSPPVMSFRHTLDISRRRPAPLPPEENDQCKKSSTLKPPPLPTTPRPIAEHVINELSGDISRTRSMESLTLSSLNVGNDSYSYAYNTHGGSLPSLPLIDQQDKDQIGDYTLPEFFSEISANHKLEDDGNYEIPNEAIVDEFTKHLQTKDCNTDDGYEDVDITVTVSKDEEDDYVTPDESVVNQFQWNLERKQPLQGQTDQEEDSDQIDLGYIEPLSPPSSPPPQRPPKDNKCSTISAPPAPSPSRPAPSPPSTQCEPKHSSSEDDTNDMYSKAYEDADEASDVESDHEYEEYDEEPLYQVYAADVLQRQKTASLGRKKRSEGYLDTLTLGSNKAMRMLWSQLPEVRGSGILDTIKTEERKRQEAMFEVITSEASYLKSLNFLVNHFMSSDCFNIESSAVVVDKEQHKILFSNIEAIKEESERFLDDLRIRQGEAVVISTISDIILEHAAKYFEVYIKYCSNQIFQDRLYTNLVKENGKFMDAVIRLESQPACQGLTLQSFLVLPMQRITRLPLLVDAICRRCEFSTEEFEKTDAALRAVNKIVKECNEGARRMEQIEEMNNIQKEILFKCKSVAIVSGSRFLLRRGEMTMLCGQESKSLIKSPLKMIKGKDKQEQIYVFLFNDLLLIGKKKGDNLYKVFDHANRTMIQVESLQDNVVPGRKNLLSLILLENSENKTRDLVVSVASQTDKMRWLGAFSPPESNTEGETIYGSWDCPQVQAFHHYQAQQPDELSLHEGDVINVLRKMQDGWFEGERLRDGCKGWFPANHTEVIVNEHVRKRNLMQRYRLLVASKNLVSTLMR